MNKHLTGTNDSTSLESGIAGTDVRTNCIRAVRVDIARVGRT